MQEHFEISCTHVDHLLSLCNFKILPTASVLLKNGRVGGMPEAEVLGVTVLCSAKVLL
jgi:hypothetical protein